MSDDFKNLVTGLYDLLLPITDADIRKRAVKSALVMLGDDPGIVDQKQKASSGAGRDPADDEDDAAGSFNAKTKTWMKQNKLTAEQLGHVFHIDDQTVEIIAHEVPGENLREKVVNTYVLMGLRELIRNGNPHFDDEAARTECERLGTHGKTNHVSYAKTHGNRLTGSVKTGWTLTTPGLKAGAELVKGLVTEE
jgi:hypothetical protein